MTFQQLCELTGKEGRLPKVRYKGPTDKRIKQGSIGQVVAIKDQDGSPFRGCAVVFTYEQEKIYPIWFADAVDDVDRRSHYMSHLIPV